jgi:hypothetical protein
LSSRLSIRTESTIARGGVVLVGVNRRGC